MLEHLASYLLTNIIKCRTLLLPTTIKWSLFISLLVKQQTITQKLKKIKQQTGILYSIIEVQQIYTIWLINTL